jgi:hypothetical protein
MINYRSFQNLYQYLKGSDIRLFEVIDKISDYLQQAIESINAPVAPQVYYGTSTQRGRLSPSGVPNGSLFVETNTGNTIYQAQYTGTTILWILVQLANIGPGAGT